MRERADLRRRAHDLLQSVSRRVMTDGSNPAAAEFVDQESDDSLASLMIKDTPVMIASLMLLIYQHVNPVARFLHLCVHVHRYVTGLLCLEMNVSFLSQACQA